MSDTGGGRDETPRVRGRKRAPDGVPLPTRKIIIGPSEDMERAKLSLEMLLRKYDFKDVEIAFSDIPFRP